MTDAIPSIRKIEKKPRAKYQKPKTKSKIQQTVGNCLP